MCSHEKITWEVVRNTVAHRMIDNSLIHKFTPSQKIRKRTKLMNAEIKKRGIIKNYDVYKALKTHVTQKVPVDYDTDDTDYLSDVDYSIIHNSNSKLEQYRIKNSSRIKKTCRVFTSDEDEMDQTIKKMKKNSSTKSIEKRTKKSVRKQLKKSADIRQQDNYISQAYFSDNKDDGDDEKSEAMRMTKKNSKTKTVENNTKKSLNIRQKDFVSQGLYTSDENDDVKESQTIQKTKENSKVKPVEKSTKESVNIQQHFTSQALFTSDENDYEKESQMICKTKKNNTVKPVEKKAKKSMNIGWQEIVKKNRNTTLVSDNRKHIDISNDSKQNVFQSDECDGSKTISNKRSLSPKLESQDDIISCTTKSANEDASQNHSNTISVIPESDSPSNSESDSQNNILHNTTQNHEDSVMARETNFESNVPITSVVFETDSKEEIIKNKENDTMQREVIINRENDTMQKEFDTDEKMMDKSNSWSLQISSNDETHESKLATLNIQSSPINDPPSSISKRSQSSVSKDRSCEKLIKVEEKSSINANICDDGLVSSKSSALINNAKRNLTLMLDTVDCTQVSSLNALHDQEKDSGIDEDSQDKFMKQANKENQNNVEEVSVPFEPAETNEVTEEVREDYIKETNLKVDDMTFKEQDTADDAEAKEPEADTPELNQTEEEDARVSCEVKTLEDLCNVQKKQIHPKVTSTEIVNKRYKIVCKRDDDVNVAREDAECNSSELYTSTSCPSVINDDIDDSSVREINEIPVAQETEHEEDEEDHANVARCVSPRTEKRLQRLNLIVDSDSSDSENENEYRSIVDRGSESHTGNSNASHSSTEERDRTSQSDVPEEMDTAALCRDDTRQDVHAELENDETSNVSEKSDAKTSHNEDTRKQREGVEDDQRSHISEENNVDVSRDKDNVSNEERPGDDKRICTSGKRHNRPASPNDSNVDNEDDQRQKDVRYRPCNLEELVEDEELLVETLPASLTLTDISEDEEAFILNIPDKVLQSNLQGQLLILKNKTIRFGKSKFRAAHNKVNTVSCIFATGKRQKPYKIVNLKEISTITVRERLLRPMEDAADPNSPDVDISSNEKLRKKRCISN